ncbi:TPA: hypothetical protein ACQVHH_005570, partial [Serratia marcescens]
RYQFPTQASLYKQLLWANFLSEDEIQAPHVIPWQGNHGGGKIHSEQFVPHDLPPGLDTTIS